MDDKKKKKYVNPEAELINFAMEDIITESLNRFDTAGWDDGNVEDYQ